MGKQRKGHAAGFNRAGLAPWQLYMRRIRVGVYGSRMPMTQVIYPHEFIENGS